MRTRLLIGLVVLLAIAVGVLGTLLFVRGEGSQPPTGSEEQGAAAPDVSPDQVETEFGSALQNSGETGPYDVASTNCEEADAAGAFDCSVNLIGAASSGTGDTFDPTPEGTVPPQGVTYRVTYDEGGGLSWARSSGTGSPGSPTPPQENPQGSDPLEGICSLPTDERDQQLEEGGFPPDACGVP